MSVLVIEGLDERKTKILKAIIKNYLDTGEPVGSRTISKYTDLHLSSATIRNEMSDLEELGYILQPHTSAGRIPSDKGYRFYVDNLIAEKNQEISDMQNFVIEHTEKMEKVLKSVAKLLANNTEYAAMITGPQYHHRKLKFIQLSNVDAGQLLCVIVLEGNVVKNKMLAVDEALNDEQLLKMNILLNTSLNGLSLEQINLGTIAALKDQAGAYSSLAADVLDAVAQALGEDEDLQIYTSGATNIFKYPELSNSEKASEFISAFEEKKNFYYNIYHLVKGISIMDTGKEYHSHHALISYFNRESRKDDFLHGVCLENSFRAGLDRLFVLRDQYDYRERYVDEEDYLEAEKLWKEMYPALENILAALVSNEEKSLGAI